MTQKMLPIICFLRVNLMFVFLITFFRKHYGYPKIEQELSLVIYEGLYITTQILMKNYEFISLQNFISSNVILLPNPF